MKTMWSIILSFFLVVILHPDTITRKDNSLLYPPQCEKEFSSQTPKKQPLAEPLYFYTTYETGKNESKLPVFLGEKPTTKNTKRDTRNLFTYKTPYRRSYLLPQQLDLPPPSSL